MSVALRGNLTDFGIAEVFQLIGQQRKTGILMIEEGALHARLAFDNGAVVWATPVGISEFAVLGERLVRCGLVTSERLNELLAESEASARSLPSLLVSSGTVRREDLQQVRKLLTRDTIFQVLRLTSGSFDFSARSVRHKLPPSALMPAEQILMDGLRMVDEWRTFAEDVPSGETVFEATGSLEDYRRRVQGDSRNRLPHTERIFQLVDGRLSVRRIVDLSRMGLFEATRALAELRKNGLVQVSAPRPVQRSQREKRPSKLWARCQLVFASVLPFVLLGAAVWTAHQQTATPRPGFALDRSPRTEAHEVYRKRALSHALDAHRYATSQWPDSLTGPDPTGLLAAVPMASDPGDPYYYARREGGYVLLSPRH